MRTRTARIGLLLMLVLSMGWGIAYAADGDLDPTFGGGDGLITTNFHNTADEARAVAIQDDRKIVVVGRTHISGNNYDFSVARYHSDGTPDATFGDGKVTTDFFGSDDEARAVAIQPNGKIVVAGSTFESFSGQVVAVARYNPDGTLDTSFDGDGKSGAALVGVSRHGANGVAIQSNGKIVVAGYAREGSGADFFVVRFNSNGTYDGSFGPQIQGAVITNFFGGGDEARAVALRHDGKIIVAGTAQVSGSNYDFALAQYNADGSLDTTFSGDGKATVDFFGGDDGAYAVAILPADGRILVAGAAYLGPFGYNFGVARFHADGRLDTTFDLDGIQIINFADGAAEEVAYSMALQADRKIVVVGYAPVGGINDFALLRLNEDGSLDGSFGSGGRVTHDFGGGVAIAYGVAIQLDGRIVAAGTAYMGDTNNYDFAVARYRSGDLPPLPRLYMPVVLK